jgi:hypothetical protein
MNLAKLNKIIFIVFFMNISIQQFIQYKMQQNIIIRQLIEYEILKSYDYNFPNMFVVEEILRAS